MSQWSEILTPAQIDERFALCASLDAGYAARQRAEYEEKTADQLSATMNGAWFANDSDTYQLCRSYLANKFGIVKP